MTSLNGQAPQKQGRWLGPLLMMLATMIAYIDRQVLAVLSPMILRDTGLSAAAFGDALSAFSVAYMIANPIAGSFLDAFGLARGMFIAVLIWTVASASHAWVAGPIALIVARTVLGVGEGAAFPGCVKMAVVSLPPEKRGLATGMAYSGAAFGSLITPLTVTPLALRFGWRSAFLITGALGTLWLIAWRILARPPLVPNAQETRMKWRAPNPFEARFWMVFAIYGMGAVAIGVIAYMSPLYLNRALGLSQQQLGYVLWIPTLGWEAGYFFWGWVSDRIVPNESRPVWVVVMLALLALPSIAVTHVTSWQGAVALFVWAMFIADGFIVMGLHIGARVYGKDQAALAGGIAGGSWGAVLAVVLPIYGRLIDKGDYAPIFLSMSLLPTAGTLLWLWLSRRRSESEPLKRLAEQVS